MAMVGPPAAGSSINRLPGLGEIAAQKHGRSPHPFAETGLRAFKRARHSQEGVTVRHLHRLHQHLPRLGKSCVDIKTRTEAAKPCPRETTGARKTETVAALSVSIKKNGIAAAVGLCRLTSLLAACSNDTLKRDRRTSRSYFARWAALKNAP